MNLTATQKAYIRLGVAGIAFLNLMLTTYFGWKPFPYSEDQIYNGLSIIFMIVTTLWTWFKDAPVTSYGKAKDEAGRQVVGDRKDFMADATSSEDTTDVK